MFTPEEAYRLLIDLPEDLSVEEDNHSNSSFELVNESSENSDSSDDESQPSISNLPVLGSRATAAVSGKDKTVWFPATNNVGRAPLQNIFTARPGITNYCRNIVSPVDAWRLIIDEGCIRYIVECTNEYASQFNPEWKTNEGELDKFIGILYLRGIMYQRNFPFDFLWSREMGSKAITDTMSRNRFRDLKKFIRFDRRNMRRKNLENDKFAMISWVLNGLVENSMKAYIPDYSMTIDEQLFPTKARCRFTQYMSNKPDKFGIKFWILAEVNTKYCYNIIPYLGKDMTRNEQLGTYVVRRLSTPLFGMAITLRQIIFLQANFFVKSC